MDKKVVIGLSGGIDSTMAALLLKEQRFNVVGLHFSFEEEKYSDKINSLSDKLQIPITILDIKDDFEAVKKSFVNEYLNGRTPSPCTFCNRIIKWKKLIEFANQENCEFVSSGHYIRKVEKDGFYFLRKGKDVIKDQSYFLWELKSETIKRMINPLGDYNKTEIKKLALKYGFNDLLNKKESMGVCFLQNMDYRTFIKKNYPEKINNIGEGNIKDEAGNIIGKHEGYIYYTIGQKRGLKLFDGDSAYVNGINPERNELVVSTKESLYHYNIKVSNLNLINPELIKTSSEIIVNVRGYGLNPEEKASIVKINPREIEFKLNEPAWAVAPGQPVVFYDEDVLIGGGIAGESW